MAEIASLGLANSSAAYCVLIMFVLYNPSVQC